jgi:hypothetical protein
MWRNARSLQDRPPRPRQSRGSGHQGVWHPMPVGPKPEPHARVRSQCTACTDQWKETPRCRRPIVGKGDQCVDRENDRSGRGTHSAGRDSAKSRTALILCGTLRPGTYATSACKEAMAASRQTGGIVGSQFLQASGQVECQLACNYRIQGVLQRAPRSPTQ